MALGCVWAATTAGCGRAPAAVTRGTTTTPPAAASAACVIPGSPADVPQSLQATGCFDASNRASTELIPYVVNVALWVDGANKGRWLALPGAAHVDFGVTDPYDPNTLDPVLALPPGSGVFKSFTVGTTRVETRLLARHVDGSWGAYSYAWNAAQDAATLVPNGVRATLTLGDVNWTVPSRQDCLTCHGTAAGTLLGMQRPQLDRSGIAADGSPSATNQLQAWSDAGWLDAAAEAEADVPWPALDDAAAPIATRARAYLAANCSFCHRLGGASGTATDYRFDTPLGDMGICNVAPARGNAGGPAGTQLLTPGSPATSVLSLRVHSTVDGIRMPPIGHTEEDAMAAALLDQWITALTDCSGP